MFLSQEHDYESYMHDHCLKRYAFSWPNISMKFEIVNPCELPNLISPGIEKLSKYSHERYLILSQFNLCMLILINLDDTLVFYNRESIVDTFFISCGELS